jgi:hypothetical protein
MHLKLILTTLLITVLHSSINAQVYFKTEHFGMSSFRDDKNQKVGNSKGSASVYSSGINVPFYMKRDTTTSRITAWGVNASGAVAFLDNKNFSENIIPSEIMNASLSIIHLRPLNAKWSIGISAGVGIYAPNISFSKINHNHILGNAGVLFIHHLKPNLEFGLGGAVNNALGYPMIFPALYFKWNYDRGFNVKVSLMTGFELSVGYNINKNLSINLIGESKGEMALYEENGKRQIFTHQSLVFGIHPEFKLGKNISIPITIGVQTERKAYSRELTLENLFSSPDLESEFYPAFQVAPYISTGIKLGF